jgi:hypothetical protein
MHSYFAESSKVIRGYADNALPLCNLRFCTKNGAENNNDLERDTKRLYGNTL